MTVNFNEASWHWHKLTTNPDIWVEFEKKAWEDAIDTCICPVCLFPGLSAVSLGKHRIFHDARVWPE